MNNVFEEFQELEREITKTYYRFNPQFKQEFLAALKHKTGNNNVGILCTYIMNNLDSQKVKMSQ